ncbi:tetratricopeptide repeat protein [Pelagicoccus mobilis]|uniref:Tetratricopeptide repeat protein n=1 Tax=Pelagicoccus mobilis TaxID=415221 RepID=A0A934S390_9BACT|nr:tetratricopeptide repeat protein [Pelagicoccus mobilis]MBK1878238.1 tetratricopeptide repeat protein [Pelagicoccus mobilis]
MKSFLIRLMLFPAFLVTAVLGAGAPAPAEGEEEVTEEVEDPFADRIVIVQPKKELDPELASEQVMRYYDAAVNEWSGGDFEFAERYFAAALGVPTDVPEKEVVLNKMGELYAAAGMFPKSAAIYERLATEFPESRRLPEAYLELGNIYRKMGAQELAISRYYKVLNSSLHVSFDQLEKYKQVSRNAQLAIAETHKEREEYQESYRLYQALFRLELKPVERLRVHYRMCYLLYELSNYQQAVSQLKLFLDEYPESPHNPELRYLLAKSYEKLNRKPEALREVVNILQAQSNPLTGYAEDADYWKQRTGNELANEFYENGDFRSALKIYQSLARYSASPSWRWPAIHQIGLCFERLGLPEKAKLAYQEILNPEDGPIDVASLGEGMRSLRQMAQWRLEHLNWEDDLVARLQLLKAQ